MAQGRNLADLVEVLDRTRRARRGLEGDDLGRLAHGMGTPSKPLEQIRLRATQHQCEQFFRQNVYLPQCTKGHSCPFFALTGHFISIFLF
jgi:hypothetical protein